jgi:hypothetical protein
MPVKKRKEPCCQPTLYGKCSIAIPDSLQVAQTGHEGRNDVLQEQKRDILEAQVKAGRE